MISYNKIINAINEGLKKTIGNMIIDDDISNTSKINYQRSSIRNYLNNIQYYVSEILNGNMSVYKDFKKYCLQNNEMYKPTDIHELVAFFQNTKNLDFIDTTDLFTLITHENIEIPLHKFNGRQSIKFIKINSPELMQDGIDNSILIYECNNFLSCQTKWHSKLETEYDNTKYIWKFPHRPEAQLDYNGYNNTYNNPYTVRTKTAKFSPISKVGRYHAFMQCASHNMPGYNAYLPAAGQILIIIECMCLIDYFLESIAKTYYKFSDITKKYSIFWTSTDADYNKAWCYKDVDKKLYKADKNNSYIVLPIFRKI